MTKKLTLLFLLAGHFAFAQVNQITKFFPAAAVPTGGAANVQALVSGYITPIGEDLGALGNNGWYSTAATHQKFGFDISVTMNTVFAKSEQKTFSPGALSGLSYDGTIPPGDKAPTAYGAETVLPKFTYTAGPNSIIPNTFFLGPGGGNVSKDIPIGSLAIPTLQVGLGLFANTDLKLRYTPTTKINGTELNNWGVGLKHDIKQHFSGIKMAPFSLALLLAYSQMTATTDLSGYYTGSGQNGKGQTNGFTAQILASKSLAVVTFYVGLGYNSSTTTYSINGVYNVDKADAGPGAYPLVSPVTLTNPYKQDFTLSGFRGTGGMTLKFGPVALNGDYTLLNGKGLMSLGFGLTFR
jgi:hypothetical protein